MNTYECKFEFGAQVKDYITGFCGILTGYAVCSTGTVSYLIERLTDYGELIEKWVDASRVVENN